MDAIKINGLPIYKGFKDHGWCYSIYEYRSSLSRRRGNAVYASRSYQIFYHNGDIKPVVCVILSREATIFPHGASRWTVSISIHGETIFYEYGLTLASAFTKVKGWMKMVNITTD